MIHIDNRRDIYVMFSGSTNNDKNIILQSSFMYFVSQVQC